MSSPELVFNTVVTDQSFRQLQYFIASLLDQGDMRVRLGANQCAPDALELMYQFAEMHPNRVVGVTVISEDRIVSHSVALDRLYQAHHDGEYFCFVDTDIKARGPILPDTMALLTECDVLTAGLAFWQEDAVVPEGAPLVQGTDAFARDGFVYGCPHFAVYRRSTLQQTFDRWGVRFSTGGIFYEGTGKDFHLASPLFSPQVRQALDERGHTYGVFDTAKVVNVLLQADGHRLLHRDHRSLFHVGGVSVYLLANHQRVDRQAIEELAAPPWRFGTQRRSDVARYCAAVLQACIHGIEVPAVPSEADEPLATLLEELRTELDDLVDRYRDHVVGSPYPAHSSRNRASVPRYSSMTLGSDNNDSPVPVWASTPWSST